ncbi:putative hydro-lyase [Noviherbaspirillum galbum]|uniref:putative hydro-lyase n=1 Tax=Noviherbaspirillum galbum TaxID=2709383 RepID=UPI002E296912|nr:putative hydro-lyase [Noviherbaspirillum galbum]
MNKPFHSLNPAEVRALCRSGQYDGPTAGTARGHMQANMMILPKEFAFDFLLFCQRNPKPCPLVEVLEPGRAEPRCAPGGDVRTDLPGYRIFRDGRLVEEVSDISSFWRDDLVTFLIGCSFSFEDALIAGGIPLRHVGMGRNVAMYRTNIACESAGRFTGNMVVSMRPVKSGQIARAVEISGRFPEVHGAPVHIGHPEAIGIADLARPDFGEAVPVLEDELPVFWACGVTPQYVAELSGIPFCISHSPGKMLVTDFITNK